MPRMRASVGMERIRGHPHHVGRHAVSVIDDGEGESTATFAPFHLNRFGVCVCRVLHQIEQQLAEREVHRYSLRYLARISGSDALPTLPWTSPFTVRTGARPQQPTQRTASTLN